MKRTKIIYWIITGLLSVMMGIGAIFDAISAPEAIEHITHIGYPAYLLPFLGVAKILGIIALLIPGFPRIKEWAYAGLFYDLIGALYSHIAFGDPVSDWAPLFILFALIGSSYFFYHKLLKETVVK
jgi:uncharacterized membrane protein YphA (DoxX/SURF4 family)